MALFRPYERKESSSKDRISALTPKGERRVAKASATQERPGPTGAQAETVEAPAKKAVRRKDGPTMSRREAETARMERLHPTLTKKQQRKADAAARAKARTAAWAKTENSPERRLLRNYVDARWTVAEFMMPTMILVMAASMATMQVDTALSFYVTLILWVLLVITSINTALMWRGFKQLLAERHPGAPTRGLLAYMFNRALMIRRFRQPSPVIKRGEPF